MKALGSPAVFAILYILFMIPTYVLPYFGSNSSMVWSILLSEGAFTELPFFFLHVIALLVLMDLTWYRGRIIGKNWLIIFPILAGIFDLTPTLSLVPLVPTVMHLFAIIMGVTGAKAVTTTPNE